MEETFYNTIDAFITTLKLYENLGRKLPDSIRLNRKARPADIREFFETMNPKSQGRSGHDALLVQSHVTLVKKRAHV